MSKIDKNKASEILKTLNAKDEDEPVDKFSRLLELAKGGGNDNMMSMLLPMMMGQNGNKAMETLTQMMTIKQMTKMFDDGDDNKNGLSQILKEMNEQTDKKLEAMRNDFRETIHELKDSLPKPESEETKLLKRLIENTEKNQTPQKDEYDKMQSLFKIIQSNNENKENPIETFKTLYGMMNEKDDKYMSLKEEVLKQKNEETQQELNRLLDYINENKNDSDWMAKLRESTQTINQFQTFMEDAGLKPAPSKSEGGKVDLKYIMDTISDVVKNVAPNIQPPRKNPSWDTAKEAQRLHKKYGAILTDEHDNPLTQEDIERELQKDPHLEQKWQHQIKQQLEAQGNDTSDEDIEKMFNELQEETPPPQQTEAPSNEEPEEGKEEEDNSVDDNGLPKHKVIKGM